MRKILIVPFIFLTVIALAQNTISGTFSPAEDYRWLIAYHLRPGTLSYVSDTAIQNGTFSLVLHADSPTGTYRLVYAIPQDEFYIDVLYNGKENVQFVFDATKGVTFLESQENKILNTYFKDINQQENQIIQFYSEGNTNTQVFGALVKKLGETQLTYEQKAKGLLAQNLIKANTPYIPNRFEPVQTYVKNKKANYFNALNVKNPILQASGFLEDKIVNYVFTALPVTKMDQDQMENALRENAMEVDKQLQETAPKFQFQVFYSLWRQGVANGLQNFPDFIFENYLIPLGTETDNLEILKEIKIQNRLRFGKEAPEIHWQHGNNSQRLSGLEGAEHYLLVFWSSSCSHCLDVLPTLEEALGKIPDVKVIAIGLEDEETDWKTQSAQLKSFEHILALGKWENKYAKFYGIQQTPTYFVLDSKKRIRAKPNTLEELLEFLEK